ncbi:helix-turn-helix domain-containing protein [Microbacterium sp. MYb66]|uniref:winged helix-turn-helix transcriptional regulator n=1 Tax=Microbacterium sp. MYb66 TaxID=1848692 RepID=UPI000CFF77BD|nr:helix-turn-helix domain-containing protein [Microbacterium sp. MYb66]PRA79810.1 transcriptional regulator [Microbacterium sp. MYb66]
MREKTERIVREWTETCDAEVSIAVLGGAWKPSILTLLGEHEVLRFGELGRLLENPTARVLTRQLRELEEDGLITRTVYREVPPKVEYRLSELGASAGHLLTELTRWGTLYAGRQRNAVDERLVAEATREPLSEATA